MLSAPDFGTHRHSNAFARKRDSWILRLLDMHPATAAMLVRIGWFPNKKKALKRLRRLVSRKRIRLVGTVCRKSGRPEHVYCRYRPKADHLLHEVEITELCLRLSAGKVVRGPLATDDRIRPDAEVWINGQCFYLELDRGTMSYAQIEQRFRIYEDCPHWSLWVCSSVERSEGFQQRAGKLRHTALFTTMSEALSTPHGKVWRDFTGERAALPREGEKKVGNNRGEKPGEKGGGKGGPFSPYTGSSSLMFSQRA